MAYKPTGRPVGRPKTKDYRVFSFKLPTDLLTRVERYARTHQQSIAELIRDGLEWRITEADPRAHMVYDSDAPHETARHAAEPSATHGTSTPAPVPMAQADTPAMAARSRGKARKGRTAPASPPPVPAATRPEASPPFDASKYYLSEELCPQKHEFGMTGRSLLRQDNQGCWECQKQHAREYRQRKKQERLARAGG